MHQLNTHPIVIGVLMSFISSAWAHGLRKSLLIAVAAAALTSCGGGSQLVTFAPTRFIAFGDESSVMDNTGRKFTVNALKTDSTALDCSVNPIWIQAMTSYYGLVFAQCNPSAVATPTAFIRAAADAKVADVVAQIDAQVASGGFAGSDLVTVLAGANDILALYKQYPAVPYDQLKASVEAAGALLSTQVNRIAALGGKVIVSTVPDLGLSPYALAQKAANPDVDRALILVGLTKSFNDKLIVGLVNNGRTTGLIFTDELVQTMVKFPTNYALSNVTDAVCDITKAPLVNACTTQTLVPLVAPSTITPTGDTHLWADSIQLSPAGHRNLGSLAVTRARGNPF
jgi:outer membrane lipase/esterase